MYPDGAASLAAAACTQVRTPQTTTWVPGHCCLQSYPELVPSPLPKESVLALWASQRTLLNQLNQQ